MWEKIKKFKLTPRVKGLIQGLLMILCVVAFGYSLIKINQASTDKINKEAVEREKLAISQRDSAEQKIQVLSDEMKVMQGEIKVYNSKLGGLQTTFKEGLLDLTKLQNEKDFIPTNTSHSEQSKFLTDYKYQPY